MVLSVRWWATLAAALLYVAVPARVQAATAKPVRHLVYAFTYSTRGDLVEQTSGLNGGAMQGVNSSNAPAPTSGMEHYAAQNDDQGTITADVTSVQSDGGLAIDVSEAARITRSAEPTTCVVYGDTNMICDPSKKLTEEEYSLLRFLGRQFVDQGRLDAKAHWQIETPVPGATATSDFTIAGGSPQAYTIVETTVAHIHGSQPFTTTTEGRIVYDALKTVPLAIHQDSIERDERAPDMNNTQHTQIDLTLQSDSLAKP